MMPTCYLQVALSPMIACSAAGCCPAPLSVRSVCCVHPASHNRPPAPLTRPSTTPRCQVPLLSAALSPLFGTDNSSPAPILVLCLLCCSVQPITHLPPSDSCFPRMESPAIHKLSGVPTHPSPAAHDDLSSARISAQIIVRWVSYPHLHDLPPSHPPFQL